jgi:predicted DNA-binding antitoxin AbrB/MazE fold protein
MISWLSEKKGFVMTLTVDATYENGMLKLAEPVPLKDHEKVKVTIQSGTSRTDLTAGMLRWTCDAEELRRVAEDDEFGILEAR